VGIGRSDGTQAGGAPRPDGPAPPDWQRGASQGSGRSGARQLPGSPEPLAELQLYAEMARYAQIGLCVWESEPGLGTSLVLVAINPAAERALELPAGGNAGQRLEAFPELASAGLAEMLQRVLLDGQVRELPQHRFAKPGGMRRTLSLEAFPLPGARVGLALEDISKQTLSEELQLAERRVLERLAAGKPLADVFAELIASIERQAPHTLGSILLLHAETSCVHVLAAPHLPEEFNRAVEGEPIGPAAGSCGTAAYIKKPVYANDIASDPRWVRYRDAALAHGLRACWSTPILASDHRVLGTFALYYRDTRGPTHEELELIARVTHVAGIAIERRELDERLRALAGHIEAVREEERTGIAREIHDVLGQSLTVLKMDVAWLGRHRPEAAGASETRLAGRLSEMSRTIDDVIHQVRRIAAQLRPGVLDDLGLAAAIEWQARDFAERSGVACGFESNIVEAHFQRDVSTAVFRILQETLTNVARHANARRVDITLLESDGHLRLEVRDDGSGLLPEATARPASLGLLGMRERAHRLGGKVSLTSSPGGGTRVVVDVPLRAAGPA